MSDRVPGTDWVSKRDVRYRRLRAQRAARAAAKPIDLANVKITQCPPAVAKGAYDAGRNLDAAAAVKASTKRRG